MNQPSPNCYTSTHGSQIEASGKKAVESSRRFRARRMGWGRGLGWRMRFLSLSLLAGFATAGLAQRPAAEIPAVALDEIFASNGMPTIGARELAVRYLRMPVQGLPPRPRSLEFRLIPRERGRKATLFGVEIDRGYFSFREGVPVWVQLTFVERERGIRMPRAEYDKLLGQVIKGVSKKTGVAAVKDGTAEVPGNTVSPTVRWPQTAFSLNYSYRVESAGGRVPFQAEYIALRLRGPNERE